MHPPIEAEPQRNRTGAPMGARDLRRPGPDRSLVPRRACGRIRPKVARIIADVIRSFATAAKPSSSAPVRVRQPRLGLLLNAAPRSFRELDDGLGLSHPVSDDCNDYD
ncbi:hypothetical protein [Nannocystis sp. SCPEA4]|uniref:hypothetical protein n=1 Tax=Nannocystis sp. SCPEA4 TaxID=2996787 RepID=UPI00226FF938|nr:hypothetical protein [Nannocystis sp. SCPEA4]MCY1061476.1 hypothetical protein [Nannocystis sp. SCPEA4]